MSPEDISPERIKEELKAHETDFRLRKWRRIGYVIGYMVHHPYIVNASQYVPFKKIDQDRNPNE